MVDSVTLSPGQVGTDDSILATAVFSDPDNSASIVRVLSGSYEWHVVDLSGADSIVQSGGNSSLSGLVHFARDEEVYVVVTANDVFGTGASLSSSSITVSNSAPTAPAISISPNPAEVGQDDLVCTVDSSSSDADFDSISYSYVWTDDSGGSSRAPLCREAPTLSWRQGPQKALGPVRSPQMMAPMTDRPSVPPRLSTAAARAWALMVSMTMWIYQHRPLSLPLLRR